MNMMRVRHAVRLWLATHCVAIRVTDDAAAYYAWTARMHGRKISAHRGASVDVVVDETTKSEQSVCRRVITIV